jgi:hypothetical protein
LDVRKGLPVPGEAELMLKAISRLPAGVALGSKASPVTSAEVVLSIKESSRIPADPA